MKSSARWLLAVGVGSLAVVTSGLALNCAPSEDLSVSVVTTCDPNKLNLADPAEATVKAYVGAAVELRDHGKGLVERIRVACNKINVDVGDPEGSSARAACNPIAKRIVKAQSLAPNPPAGLRANWAVVTFDATTCSLDTVAQAKCLDTCSGKAACDPVATCATPQLAGTCAANCTGTCEVAGPDVPCQGLCKGICTSPAPDAGPEGGVPGCGGPNGAADCVGTCLTPTWLGNCAAGCTKGFRGECIGTCTGACDDVKYPPDLDAGDPDAGDAGPPPGSGNCVGLCTGRCDGKASGSCGIAGPGGAAPCKGAFNGPCAGAGSCVGACRGSPGEPCVTSCNGACVQNAATCTGLCTACSAPLQNGKCAGALGCADANPICKGVCAVKAALVTTCGDAPMSIQVAGDYKLADALAAHAAELTALLREASIITTNLGGVVDLTPGKFRDIGVVFDNARICADSVAPTYEEARGIINTAVGARGILQGVNF